LKLALVIEKDDHPFLPYLKPLLVGHNVTILTREIALLKELTTVYDGVITTRADLLQRLTFRSDRPSISDYEGSLISRDGRPCLILNKLGDLVTSPTGYFITKRYLKKILGKKEDWFPQSEFTWELADETNCTNLYEHLSSADIIAIDIETTRGEPYVIRCVGYCGVWFKPDGTFVTHSIVLPFSSMFWVEWVRRFNDLPQPKVFQNGLFDNAYFLRFGCPVKNWLLDTLEYFHSWYSELPKSLDYITAFLLRDIVYWKDDADSGDLKDLYCYNAKDAWATANSLLAILTEAPEFAHRNYKIKFPLVFPCLAASFEGLRYDLPLVDPENPESLYVKKMKEHEVSLDSLRKKLGKPFFKPNSPKQVLQLLQVLGAKETNADEKALKRAERKHSLNKFLLDEVIKYREARKLTSTYLGAKLWYGRLLYNLRPSGTDTGRLSSTKSSFKPFGAQIQNQPPYNKQVVIADDGFYLGEADNQKSEAVCLGYISGDENLIAAATSTRDFHSINIERFFGRPYDEVWDSVTNETKDKKLRDLSKRVNHGTAYVMGDGVLLETMGLENVVKAQIMLNLDPKWRPLQVCKYLLERYHLAYPGVKKDFYEWVKAIVRQNHMLVSALGWTRYCFGTPWNNTRHFKALVAHVPQNLSVGIINAGIIRVFEEVQRPNWKDFRIKAQIHDSALFQYRIGRLDLALKAREILEQDVPVTDVKGKTRIMRIPVSLKAEATHWNDLKEINI
jgi:hypothetical protein